MAYRSETRVKDTTTSTGTGTLTLSGTAPSGYRTFSSAVNNSEVFSYVIAHQSAAEWEEGLGYVSTGTTLNRLAVLRSSNSNAAVNFSAGTKDVFITPSELDIAGVGASVFGDGSDGDATISSGTTTLSRDMYYRNLTISGTGKLDTAGWRIFVSGVLDLTNAPADAITETIAAGNTGAPTGASGTGVTNKSRNRAFAIYCQLGGGGGNGGTGVGSSASAKSSSQIYSYYFGGSGGAGGNGGSGSGGGGGTGASNVDPASETKSGLPRFYSPTLQRGTVSSTTAPASSTVSGGLRGSGGGGGGGDGTSGGGGGSTGNDTAIIWIAARVINRGASTAAGCISAKGVAGGGGGTPAAGNRGGGGGAGGTGGGAVYIYCGRLIGSQKSNAIDVTGGNGGNGGSGSGTGTAGGGGQAGYGGQVVLIEAGTGTTTYYDGRTTGGNAASGATGGTASTAATAL